MPSPLPPPPHDPWQPPQQQRDPRQSSDPPRQPPAQAGPPYGNGPSPWQQPAPRPWNQRAIVALMVSVVAATNTVNEWLGLALTCAVLAVGIVSLVELARHERRGTPQRGQGLALTAVSLAGLTLLVRVLLLLDVVAL